LLILKLSISTNNTDK